jgi:UDPglucose--hexose-1-phosphate uridylyltransferase
VDELRKDPTRGQWVLIRPKAEVTGEGPCRFCPGAEHLTGAEIAAYRKEGSPPNNPDWTVRVVPEPDAYFRVERELVREGVGMFDMITSRGASELIIESPRHDDTPATMPLEQMEAVLWMYRDRLLDLKRDGQIRDILISRRHRKPGVPVHHP